MTSPFAYIGLLAAIWGELLESTGGRFYNYKIARL
jgi:hypothetical protein